MIEQFHFHGGEKIRSLPPPCISKVSPKNFFDIAEHSKCQPGLPLPQGESQPGSSSLDGFHKTKSSGFFLFLETSTLAPANNSSIFLFDNFP